MTCRSLLSRAAVIDNIVVHYLRAVIEDKRYPELAFRACRGIVNLEKSTGRNALYPGAPRRGRTPLQHQRHGGHPRVRGGRGLSAGSRD